MKEFIAMLLYAQEAKVDITFKATENPGTVKTSFHVVLMNDKRTVRKDIIVTKEMLMDASVMFMVFTEQVDLVADYKTDKG